MFDIDSNNSDINLISSDTEPQIPESDPNLISQMITSIKSINSSPPSLETYVGDSTHLNTIAQNFHQLMSSPGIINFNSESRNTIEKAICAFIYETNRNVIEKGKEIILKSENRKKAEITKKNNENEQLKNEIKQLKEDIEMLYSTNSQITKKFTSFKRESENDLSEMKEKNDSLEETIRSMQHSIKANEIQKARLENQINESNEEINQLKSEIVSLKNKLKSKSNIEENSKNTKMSLEIQIRELETENQKLNVSINDYKHLLEKAKKEIEQADPGNLSVYEDENKKYRNSLLSVMKTLENQALEISSLQTTVISQRETLAKSVKLVDAYDSYVSRSQKEIEQLRQNNVKLEESLNLTTDDLKKIQKYKDNFDDIKKSLDIQISGEDNDDSEIFELIKNSLSKNQIISDERVQFLYTLIENQIKFLSNLITTNQIDLFTLANREQDIPLTEDEDYKNQVLMELARVRQFLSQSGFSNENSRSSELSNSNIDNSSTNTIKFGEMYNSNIDITKISNDREILDFVSSLILQSRTIQDYCEKLKVQSSKNMTIIQEIIKGIEYDDNIDDLPAVVINNIISLTDTIEEIKQIVGEENNSNLIETVQAIATVYSQFDTDIRDQISFNGDSTELPAAVHNYIERLIENNRVQSLKIIENYKNKFNESKNEIESRMKLLEQENKEMRKSLDQQNQELLSKSDLLAASEKEAENLNSQIEEMAKKQNESLSRMKESVSNCNDLQNDADRLREENKKIRDSIDQKVKQTEDHFTSLLEEEKQQHSKEIETLKKNRQLREEKLVEKLKKMQDKYHSTKDKLKEVMTVYEEAFKKQKVAVAQIKSRNDELVEELSNARKDKSNQSDKYYAENIRLNLNLKSLQIEKQNLISRIDQLTEKCDQVQAARDNYWSSQISMKEIEFRKKETSLIQAQNLFIQEIISKISSYAPKPIDISQDYVLKAIKVLAGKIEDDEYLISSLQQELAKPVNYPNYDGINGYASYGSYGLFNGEINDDDNKPVRLVDSEWEKWGREMYSCTMDGDVSTHSSQELRNILGEMIIASISQRDLVKKLKSLRIQKNLLLRDVPLKNIKTNKPIQFKVLCIVVLTAKRIFTKNNVSMSLLRK